MVSALLIGRLRIPPHAGQLGGGTRRGLANYVEDARSGFAFARCDRFISRLLVVQALASLATGATSAMLVVLSERHLHQPPAGFAWLIGAIGAGAPVGPLIPNTFARDNRDTRWLFIPYVLRGIGDGLLALLTPLPLALLLLFIYGLNTSTGMVVFNSTLQGAVPDAVRGRVSPCLMSPGAPCGRSRCGWAATSWTQWAFNHSSGPVAPSLPRQACWGWRSWVAPPPGRVVE